MVLVRKRKSNLLIFRNYFSCEQKLAYFIIHTRDKLTNKRKIFEETYQCELMNQIKLTAIFNAFPPFNKYDTRFINTGCSLY